MANPEAHAPSDFFHNLSKTKQHFIALAILFVIPFVLFFQTTLGGKELQRHDITQWRAGAESIIEYREEFGEEPLWATNMFAGMPAYVISLPPQVPHLTFVYGFFNKIYPALPFWIMMTGMYFFLTLMGFRPLTAVFGSILLGCTSYFSVIVIAGHTSKLKALAYIPWIFSGYWIMTRREKSLLAGLLLFMASFALEMKSGHPQITYYFMYLLGALWVFDSWKLIKEKAYKHFGVITSLLVVGGIIGILGNAEKVLALREYAEFSIRGGSTIKGTGALDTGYAFLWSQGIAESLTLLIPDLFGGASPEYWGPKSITSGPHYLGALALPFILIALFRDKNNLMYLFFGVGTLGLFFAWGNNFSLLNNFAFDVIPFFSKFRAPETWLVLTIFCYSVVAVFGVEWLINYSLEKTPDLKKLYFPLGGTVAVLLALFLFTNSLDYIKAGEVENIAAQIAQQNQVSPENPQVQRQAQNYVTTRLVPGREEKASADVMRFAFFIAIALGLSYLLIKKKISIATASFALVIVAAFDLIQVDKRYMPERNFVSSNVDPERYIESQRRGIDTYIQENVSRNSVYPYRVFPLLDNPFSEAIPSYFYPSLGGYTGARLSVSSDVLMGEDNLLFSGPSGINLELLSLLNTKYLTYRQGLNIPGLSVAYQGQNGVVYEIQNVLPKAFFVDSVIHADSPQEAYEYLKPGNMNFRNTAVVESSEVTSVPDSTSSVEVVSYTGPEMTINVNRSEPGFLVLSEIYYPKGWVAELDGEEIPIYKTNYMFRGMQIPAGEHSLTLDFRPDSFYTGVKLSWFSLICQLLLAGFVGFTYFRNRTSSEEQD